MGAAASSMAASPRYAQVPGHVALANLDLIANEDDATTDEAGHSMQSSEHAAPRHDWVKIALTIALLLSIATIGYLLLRYSNSNLSKRAKRMQEQYSDLSKRTKRMQELAENAKTVHQWVETDKPLARSLNLTNLKLTTDIDVIGCENGQPEADEQWPQDPSIQGVCVYAMGRVSNKSKGRWNKFTEWEA